MKFRPVKIGVFLACLAPLAYLVWRGFGGDWTADPVNYVTHFTGDWTLRFLLITLAITPLRRLTKQYWLVQYRRMVGLYAFFYGCLHLLTWVVLDKVLSLEALGTLSPASLVHEMALDIAKRRYITIGMLAFGLIVPLALTSTRGWIRRLGKGWQKLHRLIYFSAAAGIVHYWWLVKADTTAPRYYALLLAGLLLLRAIFWSQSRHNPRPDSRKHNPATAPAVGD